MCCFKIQLFFVTNRKIYKRADFVFIRLIRVTVGSTKQQRCTEYEISSFVNLSACNKKELYLKTVEMCFGLYIRRRYRGVHSALADRSFGRILTFDPMIETPLALNVFINWWLAWWYTYRFTKKHLIFNRKLLSNFLKLYWKGEKFNFENIARISSVFESITFNYLPNIRCTIRFSTCSLHKKTKLNV